MHYSSFNVDDEKACTASVDKVLTNISDPATMCIAQSAAGVVIYSQSYDKGYDKGKGSGSHYPGLRIRCAAPSLWLPREV